MYESLISNLREHAEWAHANEWESPITLGDDLEGAIKAIEALQAELDRLKNCRRECKIVCLLDEYNKKCAELEKVKAIIDEHAYKVQMFPQLYEENKNLKDENFRLRIYKDAAVHLAGRLVALCNPPKDMNDKLFRKHINRPGDYMGSGYDFIDGFNRVFDEFEQVADEQLYRAVRDVVEYEIQKWRGPDGRGED